MLSNRVELNDKVLDSIVGGITFNPSDKSVRANAGGKVYYYDSYDAYSAWMMEHAAEYRNWSADAADQDALSRLLAAGIIHE